eukprot:1815817-Ditylum_brightwellii.AAC.1
MSTSRSDDKKSKLSKSKSKSSRSANGSIRYGHHIMQRSLGIRHSARVYCGSGCPNTPFPGSNYANCGSGGGG